MEKVKTYNVIEISEKLNEWLENKNEVVFYDTTTEDDTGSLVPDDSGKTIVLDKADGSAISLPIAEVGLKYKFLVKTTVTSNGYIISTSGADVFKGALSMVDTDSSNVFSSATPSAGNNTLTMNGTTRGGLSGTIIFAECVKAGEWFVSGRVRHTGNVATPFSTVS